MRRPLWTADELQSILSGTWVREPDGDWEPVHVRVDVRAAIEPSLQASPADPASASILFVRSEQEWHRWFKRARSDRRTTGCVVVEHGLADSRRLPRHWPVLSVPSRHEAIRALALASRKRMKAKVIAVTGSVGKTTTTNMLAQILRRHGSVTCTLHSNFASGVLETLASVPEDCCFAIFEVGLGDRRDALRRMSALLRPDVVVLTQVGLAHLDILPGELHGPDALLLGVLQQKLQLTESLIANGSLVVNSQIPLFDSIEHLVRDGVRTIPYGAHPRSQARLLKLHFDGRAAQVAAQVFGQELHYSLGVPGEFMAMNSLAAILAAHEVGVRPADAAKALDWFEAVAGRAKVLDLAIDGANVKLIDDSFNATPLSIRSTFKLLAELAPPPSGRRIAVLGDIAHLGAASAAIHASLADDAVACSIDQVYTFGPEMRHLHDALPSHMAAGHFTDQAELAARLIESLRSGDVISIKASMPSNFGRLVSLLTGRGRQARPSRRLAPGARSSQRSAENQRRPAATVDAGLES